MDAFYSSTVEIKLGTEIDYPDALRKLDSRDDIYILPPTKGFREYIYLFPGFSSEKFSNNEVIQYPHRNYIFYKTKWYEPNGIFKKMPIEHIKDLYKGNIHVALSYYEKCLKGKNYYKFPYSYFDFTTSTQNEFKQKAIQPIRDLLSSFNLLTPDNRGKGTEEKRKKRQIIQGLIVKAYKKAKIKRPIPGLREIG